MPTEFRRSETRSEFGRGRFDERGRAVISGIVSTGINELIRVWEAVERGSSHDESSVSIHPLTPSPEGMMSLCMPGGLRGSLRMLSRSDGAGRGSSLRTSGWRQSIR